MAGRRLAKSLKFSRVGHDDAHDIDATDLVLPPDQRSIGEHCPSVLYVHKLAKDVIFFKIKRLG